MVRFLRVLPPFVLAALPCFAVLVTGPEVEVTQPVPEPPAFSQWGGRIASDGRDLLAVWTESAGSTSAVHAARVSADGRRLDACTCATPIGCEHG